MHVEDWLTIWRRRVWRFAGAVVTENRHKWSFKAFSWNPELQKRGWRKQARPRKRWDADISNFVSSYAET
eukprot:2013053-Karenia_brevis.AAC.1